jgi:hypothetical protein
MSHNVIFAYRIFILGGDLSYCPNCGATLAQKAKFCSECGNPLLGDTKADNSASETPIEESEVSIFELGNRLEEVVEKIYKSKGYITIRRQRLVGVSGTKSEIDIIAKRGNRAIAIECKNYSYPVGIDKVRDFSEKLRDVQMDGVFVALNGLTYDASQFAEARHIETMDSGELAEKWLAISIGRGESRKGQSLKLDYALPLNVSFTQATKLHLLNKQQVKIANAELIFHPYFLTEYAFAAQFKDPTKGLHPFKDKDTLFVDALDGKVLNPLPEKGIGIFKAIQTIASSNVRLQNARTKKILLELQGKTPQRHYDIEITEDYRVSKLKPAISLKQASESAIDFITEKNTCEINYTPKSEEDKLFQESHSITFVPKRGDIRILRSDVIILPRWSVEFEALNKSYRREVLACSGTVLEDTMLYCPKHFQVGGISFSQKQTVAVCEVCGQSLCEKHLKRCLICNKWLCEEHGVDCEVCQSRFCKEHNIPTCSICNQPLCIACTTSCPICHTTYGIKHSLTCDICRQKVCPNCIITTGFIRKNRTCKGCVH